MKQTELTKCIICDKGVAHDRSPMFFTMRIERYVLNLRAIQEQHGLEQMLGNPTLANVMGPDRNIATRIERKKAKIVCLACATDKSIILGRWEEILYGEDEEVEDDEIP